ncbi:hypothetical protein [Shimia sp.]|uniref:hypothetical protein n=1 Tax=Shimia sp. TaxID=1954381 RepID=UPI00356A4A89
MKKLVLAAALAAAASTATAGSMADPIVEPMIVEAEASSSADSVWVPALLLLLVAGAVAAN